MKIAVSYLKSDNYKKCVERINNSNADYIHVDMCDGKYVETKNFTISELTKLLKNASKPLDIHMMVKDSMKYIDDLAMLNVDTITIHIDSEKPFEVIDYIQSIGLKAGIAINPNQDINMLKPFLNIIDQVLVLSVYPGKGGQTFIPETIDKIVKINEIKNNYHFITAVDGGINDETIHCLDNQNIDLIISGSYITDSADYNEKINTLKQKA